MEQDIRSEARARYTSTCAADHDELRVRLTVRLYGREVAKRLHGSVPEGRSLTDATPVTSLEIETLSLCVARGEECSGGGEIAPGRRRA